MKKDRVGDQFLEELKRVPIVQIACEKCGLTRQTIYRWRKEDYEFRTEMDLALSEGESLVNDMCESQLLSLIKGKHFGAVRFWLNQRHPKYKKEVIIAETESKREVDRIMIELGLTPEDFSDENLERTEALITKHLFGSRYG